MFADAIGGARGETIALAAELARAGVPTLDDLVFAPIDGDELVRRADQHRRLAELIAGHRRAWLEELAGQRPKLRGRGERQGIFELSPTGGWIDRASVRSGDDVEALGRALPRTPITRLVIETVDPHVLAALAQLPISKLRSLQLPDAVADPSELARLIAAVPQLVRLEVAHDHPGERDAAALVVDAIADHPTIVDLDLRHVTDRALARLAAAPIAARLRTLAIGGWGDEPTIELEDPLVVFHGAFANAREIAVTGVDGIAVPRPTQLVLPPCVRLSGMFLAAFARLLPVLGPVRELDVQLAAATTPNEELDLAVLARAAPRLERLALDVAARVRGFAGLRALPLQRFALASSGGMEARDLVQVVAQHDLVALAIEQRRGVDDVAVAIASEPRARSLRALELVGIPVREPGIAALAGSPYLASLRRLALRRTGAIGRRGTATLATQLRDLVELELPDARASTALAEHSALVHYTVSRYADADTRHALMARFGREPDRVDLLYLWTPRTLAQADLIAAIVAMGGTIERSGSDLLVDVGATRARLRVQAPSATLLALASELRDGPAVTGRTQLVVHPELRGPGLVDLIQSVVTVLEVTHGWDTYDDTLVDFATRARA